MICGGSGLRARRTEMMKNKGAHINSDAILKPTNELL